jgi:hypothetical protein
MIAGFLLAALGAVPSATVTTLTSASRDPFPFRDLVSVQQLVVPVVHSAAPGERVICGMRVISPDPSIDRAIIQHPPRKGIQFAIRALEPGICRDHPPVLIIDPR